MISYWVNLCESKFRFVPNSIFRRYLARVYFHYENKYVNQTEKERKRIKYSIDISKVHMCVQRVTMVIDCLENVTRSICIRSRITLREEQRN